MHGQDKDTVLDVRDLSVHYRVLSGDIVACNRISFRVYRGETLGLVGESGCGKTTAAMAILHLLQAPGEILGGQVLLNGSNILTLHDKAMRRVRWRELSLIPQGAMNSLNPVMRIRDQITDGIVAHEGKTSRDALDERVGELLTLVGLPMRVTKMYPHELSGGMKQRVCIAMAIALNPSLVIADEPTSALDVVVQRVVAQTLLEVKARLGVSMILIGHDMGLQAQLVDRVAVMYAGHLVEIAPVDVTFKRAQHPYTQLLIDAIPTITEHKPLRATRGMAQDIRSLPPGCPFYPRCHESQAVCRAEPPTLQRLGPEHYVACHARTS
jgi:peptide/nickel transport system ATP-binding protein